MTTPHADVVILTALPEENEAVVHALGDCRVQPWRGHSLHFGKVGNLDVLAFPIGGMGNPSSAYAATLAISVWNPVSLLLVGIAGGFPEPGDTPQSADDLRLGDVLVPDSIIGYESGKIKESGLERRYDPYRPDWSLLQSARALEPGDWALAIAAARPDRQGGRIIPRAFFAPVFSGEKVLADEATATELRQDWPKAIGVEMEGLGVALASYRGGPGFLMAKAVSDYANSAKNDDWHRYAAESAAHFAIAVLKKGAIQPQPNRPQAAHVSAPMRFSGRIKLDFCRDLHDSWEALADVYDIHPSEKRRFRHGNEPRDLWEWLEVRGKLVTLPDMLEEVERSDLADRFRSSSE